ncbi:MAG: hypothetical protein ACTSU5_09155 [Promethearchaeota archaeon]
MLDDSRFRSEWEKLNRASGVEEPFPQFVVDIGHQIKNFMLPENRRYQGATGNARGLLVALQEYNEKCPLAADKVERYLANVNAIIDHLLSIRLTSQVPLNTAFFIRRRLSIEEPSDVEEAKRAVSREAAFHMENYRAAEDKIATHIEHRIIDRVEQYGTDLIVGSHCHSGVVRRAIIKSKDYIKQVIIDKTEPEQQGVLTTYELLQAGIPVKLINLCQFGNDFRRIGLFLFGIDAVSADGTVLNKTGTRMIASLAKTKDLPVFFLGSTYKYARNTLLGGLVKIEHRKVEQKVFANHLGIDLSPYYAEDTEYRDPGGNPLLTTSFSAFDTTKAVFYDAVVSEVGFLPMREAFEIAWSDYLQTPHAAYHR